MCTQSPSLNTAKAGVNIQSSFEIVHVHLYLTQVM